MPDFCKVMHDYDKEQEDELSLLKGETIKIVKEEDEGWWEGQIYPNGKQGWFPSNFVEKCDAPYNDNVSTKPEAKKSPSMPPFGAMPIPGMGGKPGVPGLRKATTYGVTKVYAKVTFDYEAEKDDELSLTVGEMVEVVKQDADGWWDGILHGKEGAFPSNFVELINDEVPTSKPMGPPKGGIGAAFMGAVRPVVTGPKKDTCKVLHEYKAENSDELSLQPGDIVEVLNKEVDEGWWEGKLRGATGVFPNNFVELIVEDEKPVSGIGPGMLKKANRKPIEKTPVEEKPAFIAGQSMLKKRPPPELGAKPFVSATASAAPAKQAYTKPAAAPTAAVKSTPTVVAPSPVAATQAKPAAPAAAAAPVAAANSFEPAKPAATASKFGASASAAAVPGPTKKFGVTPAATTNGAVAGGASSSEVQELRAEVKALKVELAGVAALKSELVGIAALKAELAEMKQQLLTASTDVNEMKSIAGDVKTVKTSIGKAIAGFQKDIREARDERLKLSDRVTEIKNKVEFGI